MLSQDIPPSDPVDQDEEEIRDTVGAAAERSVSPPPTTREIMSGSTKQGDGANNSQMSAEGRTSNPSPAMVTKQPEEAQAEDEATAEAGILGAPTVTVVRSTL
jgi:hypothetical protein